MAMFRLDIKPVSRAKGQTAPGAAAYRAGERILSERTGETHNHSRRKDVAHTEIFLPSQFGDAPMEWARDRTRLWNAAESAEKRRNSRVAREFQIALPSELSAERRLTLARTFAREVSDRYGVAVDLALHNPKPSGDPRQFHAHLLMTTRAITREGLGAKAGLDMQSVHRFQMGLSDHKTEYVAVRERWASLTNAAFKDANIDVRVDPGTLSAQGIDRQPVVHVPLEFYRQQTKGLDQDGIKKMREEYKAWIDSGSPVAPRTVAEIRRQAVQNWLQMRSKGVESPRNEPARQRANEVSSTRGQGEDLDK
jgi:ATP-dependent exoDNAse (exonuclease V) alpha subunit